MTDLIPDSVIYGWAARLSEPWKMGRLIPAHVNHPHLFPKSNETRSAPLGIHKDRVPDFPPLNPTPSKPHNPTPPTPSQDSPLLPEKLTCPRQSGSRRSPYGAIGSRGASSIPESDEDDEAIWWWIEFQDGGELEESIFMDRVVVPLSGEAFGRSDLAWVSPFVGENAFWACSGRHQIPLISSTGSEAVPPPLPIPTLPADVWERVFYFLVSFEDFLPDGKIPRLTDEMYEAAERREFLNVPKAGPSLFLRAMLQRVKMSRPARSGFSEVAERKHLALQAIACTSSPLQPSSFQKLSELVHVQTTLIEYDFGRWKKQASAQLSDSIESRLRLRGVLLDRLFGYFAWMIGAKEDPTSLHFDKKAADKALMGAIGSVGSRGTHVFRYPGLDPLYFSRTLGAARSFSLYLGRKGFSNPSPFEAESATAEFYDRVCTPMPPHSPGVEIRAQRMLLLLSRFSSVLFRKRPHYVMPAPNSGKACLEASRRKGGKRAAIFVDDSVPPVAPRYVRADTILSAGKLRTITVSSAYYSQYSFLNSVMFDAIRPCKWLVSGKTVAAWADEVFAGREGGLEDDEVFTCGDGVACTDFFDGRFADVVLEWVAQEFFPPFDRERVEYDLKSVTTHALFSTPDGDRRQMRGQLMGSDFSFPILCLITFLVHLEATSMTDMLLELDQTSLREFLFSYDGCGVNGDDSVEWGPPRPPPPFSCSLSPNSPRDPSLNWAESFRRVGGVPAEAKSPCDPEFFTINSQLWHFPREAHSKPREVGSVLPAMMLGIAGKAHLAPDESWSQFLTSPLLRPSRYHLWQPDLILLPDVPRSLGGLGTQTPDLSDPTRYAARVLWSLLSRKRNWHDLPDFADSDGYVKTHRGTTTVLGAFEVVSEKVVRRVSGFIRESEKKRIAIERFGSPKALRWTAPKGHVASPYFARRLIARRVSDPVIVEEVVRDAWKRFEMESEGWSYVPSLSLPEGSSIEVREAAPPVLGSQTRDLTAVWEEGNGWVWGRARTIAEDLARPSPLRTLPRRMNRALPSRL